MHNSQTDAVADRRIFLHKHAKRTNEAKDAEQALTCQHLLRCAVLCCPRHALHAVRTVLYTLCVLYMLCRSAGKRRRSRRQPSCNRCWEGWQLEGGIYVLLSLLKIARQHGNKWEQAYSQFWV